MTITDPTNAPAPPRLGFHARILTPAGPVSRLNTVASRYPGVVVVGVRHQGDGIGAVAGLDTFRAIAAADAALARIVPAGDQCAEVELVVRDLRGAYVHAEPVERGTGRGPMFGGCFITAGETTLGALLRTIYRDDRFQISPIPLHDRWEA